MRERKVNNLCNETIPNIIDLFNLYNSGIGDLSDFILGSCKRLDVTLFLEEMKNDRICAYATKYGIHLDLDVNKIKVHTNNSDVYFLFLFFHEYAHFKLHFSHQYTKTLLVREKEIEADEVARRIISHLFGKDNISDVDIMISRNAKHKTLTGLNGRTPIYKLG